MLAQSRAELVDLIFAAILDHLAGSFPVKIYIDDKIIADKCGLKYELKSKSGSGFGEQVESEKFFDEYFSLLVRSSSHMVRRRRLRASLRFRHFKYHYPKRARRSVSGLLAEGAPEMRAGFDRALHLAQSYGSKPAS